MAVRRRSTRLAELAVEATEVTKVFRGRDADVTALDEADLAVPRGGLVAIIGPSGSGKSTLLHCLAGIDVPTSGRVLLGGTDLTALSRRKLARIRRERIGMVFQSYNLLPQLTVRQNVVLPIELGRGRVEQRWFDLLVETLDIGSLLKRRPEELSGGQQQRVAIARALLPRPDVVLADEPTGAVDVGTAREVMALLRNAVDEMGQTVVLATHDPQVAGRCDRAAVLVAGQVVKDLAAPTPEDILAEFDEPAPATRRRSGETVAIPAPRRPAARRAPSDTARHAPSDTERRTVADLLATSGPIRRVGDVVPGPVRQVADTPTGSGRLRRVPDAPATSGPLREVAETPTRSRRRTRQVDDAPTRSEPLRQVADTPTRSRRTRRVDDAPTRTGRNRRVADDPDTSGPIRTPEEVEATVAGRPGRRSAADTARPRLVTGADVVAGLWADDPAER